MDDTKKTQKQLIQEVNALRQQVADLESAANRPVPEAARQTGIFSLVDPSSTGTEADVLNSMTELVIYQSLNREVLWVNKAAQDSVGLSSQDMVGRYCYEIWHQRDKACDNCPVVQACMTGQPHRSEITNSDEAIWSIAGYPVRDAAGDLVGMVEVAENITARKQEQIALYEAQQRYQGLFNRNNDAVFILALDGTVQEVNQRGAEMFGYTVDELLGLSVEQLIAPGEIEKRRQRRDEVLAKEILPIYERLALKKDGTIFPVEVNTSLGYDIEGKPTYSFNILRDITERKQAETALRENEETAREFQKKLTALAEVSIELSRAHDLDTLYRLAIELGVGKLGFDRLGLFLFDETMRTMTGTYGIAPDGSLTNNQDSCFVIRTHHPEIEQILRNERRFLLHEDIPLLEGPGLVVGQGWNAAASLSYGKDAIGWLAADNLRFQKPIKPHEKELLTLYGATIGHLVVRMRAEAALRESESRLRNVLENMPVMMDAFDENGMILVWNRECERVTGYSAEEMMDNPNAMSLLYPDSETLAKNYVEAALLGGYRNWEVDLITKNGDVKTISWSNISHQFPVSGWAAWSVGIDITERKRAEQDNLSLALERERVDILARFITQASHEFRTPLSIINTSTHILNRQTDHAQASQYIQRIERQVKNVSGLVEDLTTMSRLDSIQQINRMGVNLNALVSQICQTKILLAKEKDQTIILRLSDAPIQIQGDIELLSEALGRLLNNACRYTPDHGVITVSTRQDDDHAIIEVVDSGIGIEERNLPHVFERFFRVDAVGTTRGFGLGLPIVKAVIGHHQGRIEAESTLGQGSTFRIFLPVSHPPIQPDAS